MSVFNHVLSLPTFRTRWKEFEVKHGNEDTVREMLRIKRSVQHMYNTQVNMMSAQVGFRTQLQIFHTAKTNNFGFSFPLFRCWQPPARAGPSRTSPLDPRTTCECWRQSTKCFTQIRIKFKIYADFSHWISGVVAIGLMFVVGSYWHWRSTIFPLLISSNFC